MGLYEFVRKNRKEIDEAIARVSDPVYKNDAERRSFERILLMPGERRAVPRLRCWLHFGAMLWPYCACPCRAAGTDRQWLAAD